MSTDKTADRTTDTTRVVSLYALAMAAPALGTTPGATCGWLPAIVMLKMLHFSIENYRLNVFNNVTKYHLSLLKLTVFAYCGFNFNIKIEDSQIPLTVTVTHINTLATFSSQDYLYSEHPIFIK